MDKVIGMDLGDKEHVAVVFGADGEELEVRKLGNTRRQIQKYMVRHEGAVVVMESGTHSAWISRLLEEMGHSVCVGNPRKLRVIWDSNDKSDERDARILGLVYRLEPRLLHPIYHRGEEAHVDLELIKGREMLVEARSKLINHTRCVVKGLGERIPACSAESFAKRAAKHIPGALWPTLSHLVEVIGMLNEQIKEMDKEITQMSDERYPETQRLRQVKGVGAVTSLTFVLTIEDPSRFVKSRSVGAYLGMTPRRDQSGECDKQLGITKAGDGYVRALLVSCAHYIMGPFGEDCDLRRHGERIAARGGKNAKRRAIVAVARKLAVLLHRLWVDDAEYIALTGKKQAA